jgi:hypothetical protein
MSGYPLSRQQLLAGAVIASVISVLVDELLGIPSIAERVQARRPTPDVGPSPSTNRLVTIAPVAEGPTTGGVFLLTERKCVDQTSTLAAFADTSKIVAAWGCAHHDGVQVSIIWVHGNPNYFARSR